MPIRLLILLCLLMSPPLARCADWSAMQAAALSFMDVDKLAGDTMAVCERMPLSDDDRATLRSAYRTFQEVHLPQQATVRQFVEQSFTAAGPKGEQMLKQMQEPAVQEQLAFYFVTEKSSRDYCMLVFLKVLSGETLALNFDRYAKRIQEDGKIELPNER